MLILGKKKMAPMSRIYLPLVPVWTKLWAVVVGPIGVGLAVAMAMDGQPGSRVALALGATTLFAVIPGLFFIAQGAWVPFKRSVQTWLRKIPFFGGVLATVSGFLLTVIGVLIVVVIVSTPFLMGMEAAGITNGSERSALFEAVEKSRTAVGEALKPDPPATTSRPTRDPGLFRIDGGPELPTGSAVRGRY